MQIALGNINVNTGECLADYDPDTAVKVSDRGDVVDSH